MSIWYILQPFGIFSGYLLQFFPFWYVAARKIWQPWSQPGSSWDGNEGLFLNQGSSRMKQEFVFTALPSNSVTRLGELSPNE
jgi:hypothetical protein